MLKALGAPFWLYDLQTMANSPANHSHDSVYIYFPLRLASQLKVGKDPASRRAIQRILEVIKNSYETGRYESPVEAERDFRQLVGPREEDKSVTIKLPLRALPFKRFQIHLIS